MFFGESLSKLDSLLGRVGGFLVEGGVEFDGPFS